jgi:hypothetical protein
MLILMFWIDSRFVSFWNGLRPFIKGSLAPPNGASAAILIA